MRKVLFSRAVLILTVVLLAVFAVNAQVAGRVDGVILDPTGASVPNANVSLQLPGGGTDVFTTKGTTSGEFTLLTVPSGTYDLVIDAKGFLKKIMAGVKVDAARTTDLGQIRLELAGTTQMVEVTEVGTTVNTTNADISSTITKAQISNLPVADRSPLGFLQTQAGVNSARGNTTINGQRTSYTNVTLDGINVQDNFIRTNALDFLPNLLLLDQVAEVTVSTSNASAANFGGSGQISFVTPSGTNHFHGNAYWQNRNNYFRANTFFNNKSGVPVSFLNLNQLGGSFGGYVIKNKLFFYTNYEAYRNHQQTTANNTILTATARQGIYTYKDTGGGIHQVNVLSATGLSTDPTMNALLAQVPDASHINNNDVGDSSSSFSRNTAGYRFQKRDNRTRDNLTLKGDYVYSPRNSFSLTYAYNRDILDRPDQDPTFALVPQQANNDTTKLLSSAWRSNPRPTMTNEVRFGFNWAPSIFLDSQTLPTAFIAGTTYTNPVNGVLRTQGRNTDTYNYADNASWVHGKHTFQFGFQGQAIRVEQYDDAGITPTYTLGFGLTYGTTYGLTGTTMPGASSADLSAANTLLQTLAGLYSSYSQTFNVTSRTSGFVNGATKLRHDIQNNYALYLQDSWKLNRRLSLSLGVRWDYYPPVDERDSLALLPLLENNNPIQTILDPNAKLDFAGNSVGRSWYSASKRHFAPNLGIAWDPTGEGKWAIRAGYSLAYVNDNVLRAVDNAQNTNSGLQSTKTASGIDGRVASLASIATPAYMVPRTFADNYALSSTNAEALVDPGLVSPYVQQWNLSVQRTVKGTLFEARYVGNHATKAIRGFDYNQVVISSILQPFQQAANNGWLAQAATGTFDPRYNASIPGSVPTPFFNAMPNGGYLTNSSVKTYMQQGQVGELASFYQVNGVNGNVNFFPNPNIQGGNVTSNFSSSVYNGLQLEANHRFAKGLQFQGSYVFSKVLSDANGDGQTDFEAFLDIHNTKIERRRVAGFDVNHVFKFNFFYELPVGQGKRFNVSNRIASKMISGWTASGIYNLQSGNPFSIYSSRGTLNRASRSSGTNTVNTTLTLPQLQDLFKVYVGGNGPYVFPQANLNPTNNTAVAVDGAATYSGQVFYQPAAGTLGTLQRNILSGPSVWNMDARVSKITNITETKTLEFRADALNVFNHLTWYVGDQTITSTTFGKITSNFYGQRLLQFSLYFKF